jgi:hypothetical protein
MKIRLSFVSAALLLGALPVALYTPAACAAETPHAALVVDTGESEITLCVELPNDPVSGIELVKLAGEQHGLQYTLGYGGEAVCTLAGVGPEGDDCFADYPDFWGYWHGSDSGDWSWASTGAGTTTVEAGDIEGWSWGSGQDGTTHPPPPATTFDVVCAATEEGGDRPEPGGASMTDSNDGGDGPDEGTPVAEGPVTEGGQGPAGEARDPSTVDGGSDAPEREPSSGDPEVQPGAVDEPSSEPEPHVALVARSRTREEPGPPIVGLVGLGLAIGLGITAAAMTAGRRRKQD